MKAIPTPNKIHILPFARLYRRTSRIFVALTVLPDQKCIGIFRHSAQIPMTMKMAAQSQTQIANTDSKQQDACFILQRLTSPAAK